MKTKIIYFFSILQIIIRGIVSVALILLSIFCFTLVMGTGGPSIFLINFGIHILMYIAGIVSGIIGTVILIPTVKISRIMILSMFRLNSD